MKNITNSIKITKVGEKIVFEGVVLTAGVLSHAKYNYSIPCLEKIRDQLLEKEHLSELIYKDWFVGGLQTNKENFRMVDLQNVWGKITEAELTGGSLIVRGEVLDTPIGKLVKECISADFELRVRAVATTDGMNIIPDKLKIITIDLKA